MGEVKASDHVDERIRGELTRLRSSLENMLEAFAISTAVRDASGAITDFRVDYLNKKACELQGFRKEDQGSLLSGVAPFVPGTALFASLRRVVETGTPTKRIFYMRRPESPGARRAVMRAYDVVIYPMEGGIAASWRDVTEEVGHRSSPGASIRQVAELVRHSADGIAVVDRDGVVIFANEAADRLLSRPNRSAIGYHLGYPAVGDQPLLISLRRSDGRIARIEMRAAAIRWGVEACFVVNLHDVTDSHEAIERLREQARIIESVGEAIVVADPVGRIRHWNPAAERLYGWSAAEVTGKSSAEIVNSPQMEEKARQMLQILAEEGTWSGELTVKRRDGSDLPVRMVNTPVFDERGSLEAVISVSSDVTEIHRAHDDVRRSLQRTHDILESILDGFFAVDPDFLVTYFNNAAEEILKRSREEVLGRHIFDAFPGLRTFLSEEQIRQACDQKRAFSFEAYRDIESGREWYNLSVHPAVNGASIFFNVITERKQMEEERRRLERQLEQSQRLESVGRLAGGVAHDFNNVLQAVIGYSELLLRRLPSAEQSHEFVEQILRGAHRAADLTQQLLGFARRQQIEPRILDLNDSVNSLLKMLRRLISEDTELEWHPAERLSAVYMDPVQIDQILMNLVVNARDAISGAGRITISSKEVVIDEKSCAARKGFAPGRFVSIEVRDTGHGIAEELRDKIFEPFFTTKPQGVGTGLGLSTVYGIVKQNNGYIDLESEIGKGSTFRVYLPPYDFTEAAPAECTTAVGPPEGAETVLLVEDEASILSLAGVLLRDLGYQVLPASTSDAALDIAGSHEGRIHLLLTDVVMPRMSGFELWERISALRPGIRCLFMSGYAEETMSSSGTPPTNTGFLRKPFTVTDLAAKIRDALDATQRPAG